MKFLLFSLYNFWLNMGESIVSKNKEYVNQFGQI